MAGFICLETERLLLKVLDGLFAPIVIDYAFKTMDLHWIEANIMPHNIASSKVVEKFGFINEGLAKKYLKINGRWEDHIHMVLLNELMEREDR